VSSTSSTGSDSKAKALSGVLSPDGPKKASFNIRTGSKLGTTQTGAKDSAAPASAATSTAAPAKKTTAAAPKKEAAKPAAVPTRERSASVPDVVPVTTQPKVAAKTVASASKVTAAPPAKATKATAQPAKKEEKKEEPKKEDDKAKAPTKVTTAPKAAAKETQPAKKTTAPAAAKPEAKSGSVTKETIKNLPAIPPMPTKGLGSSSTTTLATTTTAVQKGTTTTVATKITRPPSKSVSLPPSPAKPATPVKAEPKKTTAPAKVASTPATPAKEVEVKPDTTALHAKLEEYEKLIENLRQQVKVLSAIKEDLESENIKLKDDVTVLTEKIKKAEEKAVPTPTKHIRFQLDEDEEQATPDEESNKPQDEEVQDKKPSVADFAQQLQELQHEEESRKSQMEQTLSMLNSEIPDDVGSLGFDLNGIKSLDTSAPADDSWMNFSVPSGSKSKISSKKSKTVSRSKGLAFDLSALNDLNDLDTLGQVPEKKEAITRSGSYSNVRQPKTTDNLPAFMSVFDNEDDETFPTEKEPYEPWSAGEPILRGFAVSEDPNKRGLKRAGKEVAVVNGKKEYMEDQNFAQFPFESDPTRALFCVFDGHGGKNCAVNAKYLFPKEFSRLVAIHGLSDDLSQLFTTAFLNIDAQLVEFEYEGCTGTTIFMWQYNNHRYLQAANVGDSEAFLKQGENIIELTQQHKPGKEYERQRVMEEFNIEVNEGQTRINGLAVSRALGDHFTKNEKVGIIARPYVSQAIQLKDDEEAFVILASDGLWDVTDGEQAFKDISTLGSAEYMSRRLIQKALRDPKCVDNITVIVAAL